MKIAIPAPQPSEKEPIEARFGRAVYFMIYDDNAGTWESIENKTNLNASQGAGIQTSEMLARYGVDVVIVGHCGPKAFKVLKAAGIRVFADVGGSIEEALEAFLSNRLVAAENANVEGHW